MKKVRLVLSVILSIGSLAIIFNSEDWKINKWVVSLAYVINIIVVVGIAKTKSSK